MANLGGEYIPSGDVNGAFTTKIPELGDNANIQDAFSLYHYGSLDETSYTNVTPVSFSNATTTTGSIVGFLKGFQLNIDSLISNVALKANIAGQVFTGNVTAPNIISNASVNAITVNATTLIGNTNASTITTGTIDNARTTANSANGASTIIARDASGNFVANTINATTVNATTFTGTAGYATVANSVAAANITGTTNANITSLANLANVGTITSGTWNANTIGISYLPTGTTGTTVALGDHTHSIYQPIDADLTAIAGLSATSGLLKKTAADTWTLDTNTYLTSYTETDTLQTVTARGNTTANPITITNTNASTSNVTGALIVTGGIGTKGNITTSGNIASSANISANSINLGGGTSNGYVTADRLKLKALYDLEVTAGGSLPGEVIVNSNGLNVIAGVITANAGITTTIGKNSAIVAPYYYPYQESTGGILGFGSAVGNNITGSRVIISASQASSFAPNARPDGTTLRPGDIWVSW